MAARRRDAKRRGFPPNLYQNGAKYFYWRDPDSKKDYGLGRDQAKAFQEARAANAEVARRVKHTSLVQRIATPGGKTLREWAPEYLKIYEAERSPAASSVKTVKSGVRASEQAPFADKPLRAIETNEVSQYIKDSIEIRGADMAKLIRKTLVDMFREAEIAGLIDKGQNPVTVTRIPKVDVNRSRLTLEQFRAVYAEALKMDPWVARALELAVLTGQRREDVAKMKFADVRDGFLHVIQTKGRGKVKLRIPVSLRLTALDCSIEECIRQARDAVVAKSILHHTSRASTRKPGDHVIADQLTNVFRTLREAAKLEWEEGKDPATFHELRSLSARLYTEQYGPELAQKILGHSTATMTDMYRDVRGSEWVEIRVAV